MNILINNEKHPIDLFFSKYNFTMSSFAEKLFIMLYLRFHNR